MCADHFLEMNSISDSADIEDSIGMGKCIVKFGRYETLPIPFHHRTSVKYIHDSTREYFADMLPAQYHIEFYSFKRLAMLHLNEDVIHSEYNPFLFNEPIDCDPLVSADLIRLYVVSDSTPEINQNDSQSNAQLNLTPPNDLGSALLSPASLPGPPNEDSSQNNISNDHEDDEDEQEDEPAEDSAHDSQNSSSSSSEYSLPVQADDDVNKQSGRAYFSHDVQPLQKDHYLTNAFKIDTTTNVSQKLKSGISYLQGWKTEEDTKKRKKVLACVRTPTIPHNVGITNLLLYAVSEEIKNGKRVWYRHAHKGFLMGSQLQPNAVHVNPIRFSLETSRDLELNVYLITIRDKQTTTKEWVFELTEQEVLRIHRSPHIHASSTKVIKLVRLLCVLEINNVIIWETIGLSNFISPPKCDLQYVLTNTSATVQVNGPPVKRQKTK